MQFVFLGARFRFSSFFIDCRVSRDCEIHGSAHVCSTVFQFTRRDETQGSSYWSVFLWQSSSEGNDARAGNPDLYATRNGNIFRRNSGEFDTFKHYRVIQRRKIAKTTADVPPRHPLRFQRHFFSTIPTPLPSSPHYFKCPNYSEYYRSRVNGYFLKNQSSLTKRKIRSPATNN